MTAVIEQTTKTNALKERISELIDSKKVNMTTIARGINKSPATISLYLQGNYTGTIEKLEEDLEKYLQGFQQVEAIEIKSLKFVETVLAKKIFNAANMCKIHGKMGVCYGAPGIGKTTAILEYQRQNTGVIFVDPYEQTSPRAVLRQIADQLKLDYSNNMSFDEFTAQIVKKLAKNKYIIILDEAENLNMEIFKIIRKIHDRTRENCGVLFVGTYELETILNKMKSGFSYISSRIGYLEKLDTLKIDDIKKLVLQYFPKCEEDLIKSIAKSCHNNTRSIQNMLDLCVQIIQSNDIELNEDVIESAREKLLI